MFHCTGFETRQIMAGKATGVVRRYDKQCPHEVGAEIVFTSKMIDRQAPETGPREIPFARVTVVSVRPGSVREFRDDLMIAEMDGHANGNTWFEHHRKFYGSIKDTDKLFHIKFKVIEMDKRAGQRGNVA